MLITPQGLNDLKKELEELQAKLQPAVNRLAMAREQGDLSENSEYAAAKEELDTLNMRILEVQSMINQARVNTCNNNNVVSLGSLVTVQINGFSQEFSLVGSVESDPAKGKISIESPVGKALLGAKAGDTVKIPLDPPVEYKILTIK